MKWRERFEKKKDSFTIAWDNGDQSITFFWWASIRKQNKRDYPDDPDVNSKPLWGRRDNGAVKGVHPCLDWTLDLGHLEINYMNFRYNKYKRRKK